MNDIFIYSFFAKHLWNYYPLLSQNIGKVVKKENDDYDLSKIVWVKSDVDFDNLLYLLVVMK